MADSDSDEDDEDDSSVEVEEIEVVVAVFAISASDKDDNTVSLVTLSMAIPKVIPVALTNASVGAGLAGVKVDQTESVAGL